MLNTEKETQQLDTIYQAIYSHCENGLYCSAENYQKIYQKILHASTVLYYNGLRVLNNRDTTFISSTQPLTAENILELLTSIHCIISEIDFLKTIEQKIRKLIKSYGLNSDELLIPNYPIEAEYFKTQIILEGIS